MSLTARFGGAALVAVCLASPAFADVDPEGRKVLDQMAAYYAQLDGVSYASKTTISMDAMPMPMTQQVTVAVARPNMIATRSDNPMMGGANVTSDGTTMLIEMPAMRIYQMGDAPKDMQNLGDVEMLMSGDLGTMLGVQMLRGGVGDLMFEDIDDLAYEGVVERDGMKAHHLRISAMEMGQSMNLDVWIADGDRPWLMGLKPELPAEATMGPDGQPMNIDMLVTFADWKGERPAASRFAIETPSDYRKVDSLMTELMAGAGEMGMGEPEPGAGAPAAAPPHPTVDKPAPEFTLNTLSSDQPIKLADLKGKVVMLDFWAT